MNGASLNVRAAYDLWAATYPPFAHNPLMRLEQEVVEPLLRRLRPTRALDVGTGSGRYLCALESAGARATGVDFSKEMLRRCGRPRVVCADACRLPFRRGAFDLVNASLVVGDIADLRAWICEMARMLRRGGHLVYSDFHPAWAEHGWRRIFRAVDGETHDLPYAAHSIAEHLDALEAAGFHVVAIREPRFKDDADPAVVAFRRRWRNPPVVVILHATRKP